MPKKINREKIRVITIVFDGGTWDVVKPLADRGKMPVMNSLMKKSRWGILKSTFPPLTCPAWFSFSTGKNPGKLGMYNFFTLVKGSYEFKIFDNNDLVGHKELWDILNERGIACAVINNPVAYPPKRIEKYMVAGFMTPSKEKEFTYPPELKAKLDEITGDYEIDSTHSEHLEDDQVLENALRVLEKRTKVFNFFMEDKSLNFLLLTYTGTDRVCHQFLNKVYSEDRKEAREAKRRLEKFFVELDASLGEVLSRVEKNDYLLLFSDHGFGKRDKGFYINQWLIDNGYLVIRREGIRRRVRRYSKSFFAWLRSSLPYQAVRFILRKLGIWEILRRNLPVPEKLPPGTFQPTVPLEGEGTTILGLMIHGRVNWKRTKAIAIPGGIYLNTVDRPSGIVTEGEYESLRDEIIEKLKLVKDPKTGRKIKIEAIKPQDQYWGDLVDRAPDIQPVIEDYEWEEIRNIPDRGEWVGELKLAHHREEGMILAAGLGVHKGRIEDAEIIDLAPTILNLFGIPVPEDMDGKVLSF